MKKPAVAYLNATEIITNSGVRAKLGVGITESDLGIIAGGAAVLAKDGTVLWTGPTRAIPKPLLKGVKRIDLKGKVLAPALADCHTHLVFDGIRDDEFAMRLAGATYEEVAAKGGGIVKSVVATRAASAEKLFTLGCERIESILKLGVGILEIKSGYGLDLASEIKVLKVAGKLQKKYAKRMVIRTTFLGAHAFPPGTKTDAEREAYVAEICERMLPAVAKQKLADACDVFFDRGYFNADQSRRILKKAQSLGLHVKVHADELSQAGGAELAAELGALSADHLLLASEKGLAAMAKAGVVAVYLPTTALYLKIPYADVTKARKAKVCMALASDFNPGSSPTFHMPFVMTLACLQMGMTMAEAFAAATYGGARALGLHDDHGAIVPGTKPRLAVFNVPSYRCLIGQMAHPGLGTAL
jgi:imidazolonepropionase